MHTGSPLRDTQRRYDETAEIYDSRYAEIQREKYAILLSMLRPKAGEKILDWGCGTGLARSYLESLGTRYFGLDFSLRMLAVHFKKSNRHLVLGDCCRLPFSNESFDGVFGATVLQNIDDKSSAYQEMFRILKPGGRAALSTLSKSCPSYGAAKAAGLRVVSRSFCGEDLCICLVRPQ